MLTISFLRVLKLFTTKLFKINILDQERHYCFFITFILFHFLFFFLFLLFSRLWLVNSTYFFFSSMQELVKFYRLYFLIFCKFLCFRRFFKFITFYNKRYFSSYKILKNMSTYVYTLCKNLQWISIFPISFYKIKIKNTLYAKYLFE